MRKRVFSGLALAVGVCFLPAMAEDKGFGSDRVDLNSEIREDLGLELGIAELRTVGDSRDPVIAVPSGALVEFQDSGDGAVVYRKDDNAAGDKFVRQKVEVGARNENYVEIRSGLFPGDSIVVENALRIPRRGGDVVGDGKGGGGFAEPAPEIENAQPKVPARERVLEEPLERFLAEDQAPEGCQLCPEGSGIPERYSPPPTGTRFVRPIPPAYISPRAVFPPGPVFRSRAPYGQSRRPMSGAVQRFHGPVCPPRPFRRR